MTYIHATDTTIIKYPFSRSDLSITFPNVSFPPSPTADDLAPFDVFPVATTPRPADTRDERAVEGDPVLTDAGWQQVWTTRPATAEEIAAYDEANRPAPDWAAFKSAALTSPALNSVLAQAFATVPVAAAALVPSLLRAEGNGVGDFAVAWSAIYRAVPVPPEVITGFQQLATASHLPAEFVGSLEPRPPIRARDANGKFIPDDPATPINEAWQ